MSIKADVVAMGELLIDFTMSGVSEQGNQLYEACPGGAPCNVLAMLSKMGKTTTFMGKVGKDQFGQLLKKTLDDAGIGTENLRQDAEVRTTLAFVTTFSDGDRDFSFYRNPGADMMYAADDVDAKTIEDAKIFHFGTLSMTHDGVREATIKAVKIAKEAGVLVSLDPNLRPPLWSSMELAKEQMLLACSYCDILKIADNEILFLTGEEDYDAGIEFLQKKFNIPLILLTMGSEGSRAYYKGMKVEVKGFKVDTIEATGAGDTFGGCALGYILNHDFNHLTKEQLIELLTFANAAAAIVTTKKGAIKSMPSVDEVNKMIRDMQEG